MKQHQIRRPAFHLAAAVAALFYAWFISQTAYVTTGLQFVAPLLIVLSVHAGLIILSSGFRLGLAQLALNRSLGTALALVLMFLAGSLLAPEPAMANNGAVETFLVVLFCVAILLCIVAAVAAVIYAAFLVLRAIWHAFRGDKGEDTERPLYDFGSLGFIALILIGASLEGVPGAYSFENQSQATATRLVNAHEDQVWAAMARATSPSFPVPTILHVFPQPVAVVVDEGVGQDAYRKVQFSGREGEGFLTLQVTERNEHQAVFTVREDTTPFANWVGFESITYGARPQDGQTRIDVTLEFRRKLAPSWFFTPLMRGAAWLAADVLARDVQARSMLSS